MLPRFLRRLAGTALCGVALCCATKPASAQGFPLPPAATSPGAQESDRERVERLEKQVQELTKALKDLQSSQPRLGSPVNTDAGVGVSRDQVTRIVSDYLAAQDEKKKKEDAKKDAAKKDDWHEVGSDLNFKASWKDGLSLETAQKDFRVRFGGRAQYDMGWFTEDPALPNYKDAAGFRRARLRGDGTVWEVVNWVTEFDFATPDSTSASATFTDVYMEITQLPVIGTFRAGHFKEFFSYEELISDNYVNTMERSLLNNAFTPSRRLGLGFTRTLGDQELATVSGGWFRTTRAGNAGFDQGDGEYSYNARATVLPYYANEGRGLIHLGAAYSRFHFNNTDNPDPGFSSRYELRLGTPFLLSTGSGGLFATSETVQLFGGEVVGVWGPLSVQSEIILAQVNNTVVTGPNLLYWGAYVQASYFLTGEHRPYSKKLGAFDRVRPHENFFLVRDEHGSRLFGRGAWELVARYSYLDLESDGFVSKTAADRSGGTGKLQDITLGVNWYFNPNFRWVLNYVRGWRDSDTLNRSGIVDGVGMRFHWDF